jgi:hypothetical protein
MNERAANALIEAAMKGVRQVQGVVDDGRGGRCALGVMLEAEYGTPSWKEQEGHHRYPESFTRFGMSPDPQTCPACDRTTKNEAFLIAHLNNDHEMDFVGIARKLGPHDGDA